VVVRALVPHLEDGPPPRRRVAIRGPGPLEPPGEAEERPLALFLSVLGGETLAELFGAPEHVVALGLVGVGAPPAIGAVREVEGEARAERLSIARAELIEVHAVAIGEDDGSVGED